MHVALDCADDGLAEGLDARAVESGLEHGEPLVHGAGGHQNLRHEDLVSREALADGVHADDKGVIENRIGGDPLLQRLGDESDDFLGLALLKLFRDFLADAHAVADS